jgi:hypothetical protein
MAFAMGISKPDVRLVINYDMPPSIDQFLQQVGRTGRDKKEAFVHTFLHDEDYFAQRNMIYLENIDKNQIKKMMDYLYSLINPIQIKQKRNFTDMIENKSPIKIQSADELNNTLPRTISFNFTAAADLSKIKKQMQLFLLLNLINNKDLNAHRNVLGFDRGLEEDKIKISSLGVGPSVLRLRFYKTSPEKLMETEPNIKTMIELSREYQGFFKFNTLEVCEKLGITHTELINYLYSLQAKGEVGYETKEEAIFLVIEKLPNSITPIMNYFYEKAQQQISLSLTKLNACYAFLRKFAALSIDSFINVKFDKNVAIKCITPCSDYLTYENEFRKMLEIYFETPDGKNLIYKILII